MAPVTVVNWLRSAYPTLRIKDDWLEACCDYLTTHFPGLSAAQLIKKVEAQILLASLESCCESGPLPAQDLSETRSMMIASGVRGSILVQVESIFDAGESALSIKNIHEQRKEEARIKQRGGNADRARIIDNLDDGEAEKGPPKYPRSMLTLQLSDGFTVMKAIEYKRIPGLSLDETKLGSKILLKDVKALRGILLLEPRNVTLKDHFIAEMADQADAVLDEQIRQRLNLPHEGEDQQQHMQRQLPVRPRQSPRPPAPPSPPHIVVRPNQEDNLSDDFFDDDDMELDDVDPDIYTKPKVQVLDDTFDGFDDLDDEALDQLDAIEQAALSSSKIPKSLAKQIVPTPSDLPNQGSSSTTLLSKTTSISSSPQDFVPTYQKGLKTQEKGGRAGGKAHGQKAVVIELSSSQSS